MIGCLLNINTDALAMSFVLANYVKIPWSLSIQKVLKVWRPCLFGDFFWVLSFTNRKKCSKILLRNRFPWNLALICLLPFLQQQKSLLFKNKTFRQSSMICVSPNCGFWMACQLPWNGPTIEEAMSSMKEISTFTFPASAWHCCGSVGSSLGWGLNLGTLACDIF